jgi:hypothetical protein
MEFRNSKANRATFPRLDFRKCAHHQQVLTDMRKSAITIRPSAESLVSALSKQSRISIRDGRFALKPLLSAINKLHETVMEQNKELNLVSCIQVLENTPSPKQGRGGTRVLPLVFLEISKLETGSFFVFIYPKTGI